MADNEPFMLETWPKGHWLKSSASELVVEQKFNKFIFPIFSQFCAIFNKFLKFRSTLNMIPKLALEVSLYWTPLRCLRPTTQVLSRWFGPMIFSIWKINPTARSRWANIIWVFFDHLELFHHTYFWYTYIRPCHTISDLAIYLKKWSLGHMDEIS